MSNWKIICKKLITNPIFPNFLSFYRIFELSVVSTYFLIGRSYQKKLTQYSEIIFMTINERLLRNMRLIMSVKH